MNKVYKILEKNIDRKIKRKNSEKKPLRDLNIITSLGWIFTIPIILTIFLGGYIKGYCGIYENFTMLVFIVLGIVFSCINIFFVVKNLYKDGN